jgi:protease I
VVGCGPNEGAGLGVVSGDEGLIAKGRKMTSFKSIKADVANAGAQWEDSEVVVDQGVITSRNPCDLEAFSAKIIEEIKEGRHTQRSAA